ncbi:fimbrial protein [Dyella sp.]|jgi:type 1 fimbria pilin|uniref:fimbrial protein n=1 Tax=Dyella sp. TaxID=1869338 RepID=UPI002FDA3505
MTQQKHIFFAALATLFAFCSGAALAQDTATIHVEGSITGSTCSLSVSSATLTIGTVQQSVFNGLNSASPPSNVGTIATDPSCTASTVSMTFMANADPNDSTLFAVTGGASGVGIKLEGLNSGGVWQQAIPNSTISPIVNVIGVQSFRARYVQSAAAMVNGTADASITVLVTYT